ncbi:hypothetical protein D3C84_973960 [compost metagenome]
MIPSSRGLWNFCGNGTELLIAGLLWCFGFRFIARRLAALASCFGDVLQPTIGIAVPNFDLARVDFLAVMHVDAYNVLVTAQQLDQGLQPFP